MADFPVKSVNPAMTAAQVEKLIFENSDAIGGRMVTLYRR